MKTIVNKTRRALQVPLPQGRKLHLGPNQSARIAPGAVQHPPLVRLVEAGEVAILDEREDGAPRAGGSSPLQESTHGHPMRAVRKGGDK
jgi:hypothetical protein